MVAKSRLKEFVAFCSDLILEDGSSFKLHPFQQRMLKDFFDGSTETLILIPKKNGKSTLLGAIALHHLVTATEPECVIGAASRDQARILYNQAAGLVRRSPKLQDHVPGGLEVRVQRGYGEVKLIEEGNPKEQYGRIRVLAADADTADGVIPTLALVDELHRHKKPDLYGVFRDGLGPRNGQMVTISTAGEFEDSPLGKIRAAAYELPHQERKGAYRYARSEDGTYVMHEWALEADDDRDDLDIVKAANPAPWQTKAQLLRRHDSPSMTPGQWARFACGVWVAEEGQWLPSGAWSACYEDGVEIPVGSEVVLGVDIGRKHDVSAVAVVWPREDGKFVVQATVLDVGAPLSDVEAVIRDLNGVYRIEEVTFDPWSFARSGELLEDEGFPVVEHPQSPERMHIASSRLYEAVMTRQIVHDGDPVLAAHVAAGATKDTERGWRLVKNPKAKRPIDALMALAMAFNRATQPKSKRTGKAMFV